MLFLVYWYIITAFCAVYINTQVPFIKDSFISFGTSLIAPFIIYLLPAVLRIIALKDADKKRLNFVYKLSEIIPFFLILKNNIKGNYSSNIKKVTLIL